MKELQDPCISIISTKLRQVIKERGIKQKKIAEDAEISIPTLNSLLCGRSKNPSFLLIKRIGETLGINSIDYLMGKPVINPSELHKEMLKIFDSMSETGKQRFIEFAKFMQEKNGI